MLNLNVINNKIDARELHEKLQVNDKQFRRWITKHIKTYKFEEGVDYEIVSTIVGKTNQIQNDYMITVDMAKELCLLSKSKLGSMYRKYLINLDKIATEQQKAKAIEFLKATQNGSALFDELLSLATEQQKQIDVYQTLMDEKDTYCVSDICARFVDCKPWDVTYNLLCDGYLEKRKTGIYPCFELEESRTIVPHHYYITDTDHVRYTNKGVVWLTEYILNLGYKLK